MSESNAYDESNIALMSAREHARLRPGMYIGGTHLQALHNLAYIVLDDFVDETLAGHSDHIWITLSSNQEITIRNNGRGISAKPVREDKAFLEILMTGFGVQRINGDYQIKNGIHESILLFAVNALSAEFKVESACEGFLWQQTYREGIPQSEVIRVRQLGDNEPTSTSITFRPDFTIFEPNEFDYEMLAERMQDLAYLLPNLTITLKDERQAIVKADEFHFTNGLLDCLADLNRGYSVVHGPVIKSNEWTIRPKEGREYTLGVEIFFQYNDNPKTNVIGFIDLIKTASGFHTDIVPLALTAAANRIATRLGLEAPLRFEEIAPGLTIIVYLKYPTLTYRSQYHMLLHTPDVCGIVADTIYGLFDYYGNYKDFEHLTQKWLANRQSLEIE